MFVMSEEVLKFEELKEGKGCSSPPRECVVEWHVKFAGGRVRVSSGVLEGAGFDCYGCVQGVFPFAHFIIRVDLASPGIALFEPDCPPEGFSSFIPGVRKVLSVSSGMEKFLIPSHSALRLRRFLKVLNFRIRFAGNSGRFNY
jgi:hypothetical protein